MQSGFLGNELNQQKANLSDIQLAVNVLKKLQNEMISSNSIISSIEIPYFYTDKMQQYIAEFGEDAIEKLLDYQKKLSKLRNIGAALVKKNNYNFKYPKSTVAIAVSMCGVGECHEGSNRVVLELLLSGCKTVMNVVLLEGNKKVRYENKLNNHCIVIIGNCSPLTVMKDLSSFANLNNDCILVDYLLNKVDRANRLHHVLNDFIDVYGLDRIAEVIRIEPRHVDYEELFKNATFFATEIMKNIHTVEIPIEYQHASMAFFAETNQVIKCTKTVMLACKKHARGEEVLKAFYRAEISLVLRKASAFGMYDIVKTIINNKSLFDNFNINEPSPSNGYTALDWIMQNRDANEATKALIQHILIENGALTSQQIKSNKMSQKK